MGNESRDIDKHDRPQGPRTDARTTAPTASDRAPQPGSGPTPREAEADTRRPSAQGKPASNPPSSTAPHDAHAQGDPQARRTPHDAPDANGTRGDAPRDAGRRPASKQP